MISFIIIGRNEGWKLTKCLKSVFDTISRNNLKDFEVIYVDSNSVDNSIELVRQFAGVRVFRITGPCNAAIGRNIGARESNCETLFFIDGDMEIMNDFLPLVYDEKEGLIFDFVSGQLINNNFSSKGKLISKEEYYKKLETDRYEFTTGGLFLIKKELWLRVCGMKNKMKVCEDLDLGLRLSKKNIFLLRKKELLAIHNTIPSSDKKKMWSHLISGQQLYRIILLRENLFNKYAWLLFFRGNYTFIILTLTFLAVFILKNVVIISLYFFSILIRTLSKKDRSLRLIINNFLYVPIREIALLFAFLFLWPKKKKEEYIAIIG